MKRVLRVWRAPDLVRCFQMSGPSNALQQKLMCAARGDDFSNNNSGIDETNSWKTPVHSIIDSITLTPEESKALESPAVSANALPTVSTPQVARLLEKKKMRYREKKHSLAAFVNTSATLHKMVELGVDLSEIEKMPDAGQLILNQKWSKTVQPIAEQLMYSGIPITSLGKYFTKNPYIFYNSVEQLEQRVHYLKSKKFSRDAISRIVLVNKFWLNFDIKDIDDRLGWIQTEYQLTGDVLRYIVTKFSTLIAFGTGRLHMMNIVMQEHFGFTQEEMKKMIIQDPKLWLTPRSAVEATFDYVHNSMGFSHRRISLYPQVLRYPLSKVRNRHQFLKSLGRDQYDPDKPHFVSFDDLLTDNDAQFCKRFDQNVRKYNSFVKLND